MKIDQILLQYRQNCETLISCARKVSWSLPKESLESDCNKKRTLSTQTAQRAKKASQLGYQ